MRRAVLLLAVALLWAGCESTQSKSARLAAQAKGAADEQKLEVGKRSKVVEVGTTAVLKDANGAAAVAELENTGKQALAHVPVLIDVQDKAHKSLFRNDAGGSEQSLVSAAVLAPGARLFWVNDQVVADGKPARVAVTVGADAERAPRALPELHVSAPRLERDEASGVAAVGKISNRSDIEQRQLVIYAVARHGGKVVAAGRGQVPKLKPGQELPYTVFFIGDPRGAKLTVAAPPTVLDAGS